MSERAASLRNYPMVMAMVLSIATFAQSANATTSAIDLDVSHTVDLATQSALLVVNCSFDANLTNMVSVASLTLFGSKPYGNQSEFDELAVFDIRSQTLNLTSDLEDADVVIKGHSGQENDSHFYLAISWNSPTPGYRQYYKCVANGSDRQRQAASIATIVKAEILNGGCCEKMDSIDSQLQEVSEKVENTCTEKTAAALTVQGRVYLASKTSADFNIGGANQVCKSNGGYLVELDNHEEFQFVFDFLTHTGSSSRYWIARLSYHAGPSVFVRNMAGQQKQYPQTTTIEIVNRCVGDVLKRWPDVLPNEELWESTKQSPMTWQ
ncbi:hypothetical protein PoB_005987400 [Plakobranchus ocellatus]|uniref:C-type lectin domain-containing protein n=1 Tax=Plakobranchus ocellatus TaxID=259542 RepID=A0AAV4CND1_9GAST|nr:hypothetical protein PoB_005987400 [Plakobranchus ocellatus]